MHCLSAVLVAFILACPALGQERGTKKPEVSLKLRFLAWPHPQTKPTKPQDSPKGEEPTEVRFLSTIHYPEGNSSIAVNLLPGKSTRALSYSGESTASFYRNAKLQGKRAFSVKLEPHWKETLLLLYPKTSAQSSFDVFPIVRPTKASPPKGIATNLTRKALSLVVDGKALRLSPWKPAEFRYSLRGKEHVRLEVRISETGNTKTVVSVKKFFGRDQSPIILLRKNRTGSRILLTAL